MILVVLKYFIDFRLKRYIIFVFIFMSYASLIRNISQHKAKLRIKNNGWYTKTTGDLYYPNDILLNHPVCEIKGI